MTSHSASSRKALSKIACNRLQKELVEWQVKDEPTAFFTFCLNDFATNLRIPRAFAKEHGEFVVNKKVRLRTAESRRHWNANIRQNNDGDFCIAGGSWSNFVADNNILHMNFLVLRIVAPAALHVTIFRDDSCFHRPPSPPPKPRVAKTKTCWRFVKELKDYHFNTQRLEIPLPFAVSTGIGEKGEATLKDWRGREWAVKVTNRQIKMYSFTSGWIHFLKANRLKPRTVLLFEFVPDSHYVIEVLVMPNQPGNKLLHQAGRGGSLISS